MVEIRGPDWDLIKEEYLRLNGKIKLKEFAEKHGVKYSTLRSRKNRENWDNEINKNVATKSATQQRNVATENKNKRKNKESIAGEVKEVLENTNLTDKQRLFCIYYIKCFNATKAYQKAYECSYETSLVNGPRLLGNARIKEEIQSLKEGRLNRAMLEPEDIFQKFMDIAYSDISDYVVFGQKEIQEVDEEGNPKFNDEGKPVIYKYNYVSFKESNEVDGTLISEVSQGKNGVSIKLQDKMKAMKWLADHMDLATEEQKARIEKLKADIAKAGGNNNTNDGVLKEMLEGLKDGI